MPSATPLRSSKPTATIVGQEFLLFDVGGLIGAIGWRFTLVFSAISNTRGSCYRARAACPRLDPGDQRALERFIRFNAVSAGGFVVQLVDGRAADLSAGHSRRWPPRGRRRGGDRPQFSLAPSLDVGRSDRGRVGRTQANVAMFLRFVTANGLISIAGNILIVAVLVEGPASTWSAANVVAVAMCGLLNYQIGDRLRVSAPDRQSIVR